jgi:hypothetical protein
MGRTVLALDDQRGVAQALVDGAFVDGDVLERVGRCQRVEDRRLWGVVDADRGDGGGKRLAVGVRQQHHWFGDMPDNRLGQARLVLGDERHQIASGHIAEVGADESRPPRHPPGGDAAVRNRRSHGGAEQQAGEPQVVDVARRPGDLGATVLPAHVVPDRPLHGATVASAPLAPGGSPLDRPGSPPGRRRRSRRAGPAYPPG